MGHPRTGPRLRGLSQEGRLIWRPVTHALPTRLVSFWFPSSCRSLSSPPLSMRTSPRKEHSLMPRHLTHLRLGLLLYWLAAPLAQALEPTPELLVTPTVANRACTAPHQAGRCLAGQPGCELPPGHCCKSPALGSNKVLTDPHQHKICKGTCDCKDPALCVPPTPASTSAPVTIAATPD
jgi:hypothetical protein